MDGIWDVMWLEQLVWLLVAPAGVVLGYGRSKVVFVRGKPERD
jgi:hypothetical protein